MKNFLKRLKALFKPEIEYDAPKPSIKEPEKKKGVSTQAVADTRAPILPASPFKVQPPPPGVVPEGAKIAMDSWGQNYGGYGGWAEGAYGGGLFYEGLMFLGYPYLSDLSQRPEYRNIVEIIAQEMTRRWIRLTSTGGEDNSELLKDIEAEFKRLNVQKVFREAIELDGYFGRSHIYLDTGDTDNLDELKTSIGSGSSELTKAKVTPEHPLLRLQVVEPIWTYPNAYNALNPLKQDFFKPSTWFVMGNEVHASRLLRFCGREVPDLLKPAYSFGGLALTQIAKPYVDNWLRTRQSVSDIIHSYSVMVLATDLSSILNGGGAELLVNRAQVFNQTRDNRGLMMIDKNEETFANVSVPLSGIEDLQAQSQEQMSSVSGIPLIKLLGITPTGLNSGTQGEDDAFNARIGAKQEAEMTMQLSIVLNLVQLSLRGEINPNIGFVWEPLSVMNEKELAEVEKLKAETDAVLIQEGVITPGEARKRIAGDEDSEYGTLDVDDVPLPPVEPGNEFEGESNERSLTDSGNEENGSENSSGDPR